MWLGLLVLPLPIRRWFSGFQLTCKTPWHWGKHVQPYSALDAWPVELRIQHLGPKLKPAPFSNLLKGTKRSTPKAICLAPAGSRLALHSHCVHPASENEESRCFRVLLVPSVGPICSAVLLKTCLLGSILEFLIAQKCEVFDFPRSLFIDSRWFCFGSSGRWSRKQQKGPWKTSTFLN